MAYDGGEGDAPFNMAVATLKRLDTILQQIRNNDILYPRDSAEKQKSYLNLVKQFYINAVPLLKPTEVTDLKIILNYQINSRTGIKGGVQKNNYFYDPVLEEKLNEALIDIQQKLQRFFMPKGKDPTRAVTNF